MKYSHYPPVGYRHMKTVARDFASKLFNVDTFYYERCFVYFLSLVEKNIYCSELDILPCEIKDGTDHHAVIDVLAENYDNISKDIISCLERGQNLDLDQRVRSYLNDFSRGLLLPCKDGSYAFTAHAKSWYSTFFSGKLHLGTEDIFQNTLALLKAVIAINYFKYLIVREFFDVLLYKPNDGYWMVRTPNIIWEQRNNDTFYFSERSGRIDVKFAAFGQKKECLGYYPVISEMDYIKSQELAFEIARHTPIEKLRKKYVRYLRYNKVQLFLQTIMKIWKTRNTKKFEDDLKNSQKDIILYAEGDSDKILLENAWSKIKSKEEKMEFDILSLYGANLIIPNFLDEKIFIKNSDKLFICMLDHDNKGWEIFKKFQKKEEKWEVFSDKCEEGLCYKHKKEKCYIFLLPVPEFRKNLASKEMKKNSKMTIEDLFSDELLKKYGIEDARNSKDGCELQAAKKKLCEKSKDFDKDSFESFEPIFALIDKIIKNTVPSS